MPHSPYYFLRGGVHISLLCPPSSCVCMCAVNAGGCVIDLLVQGWAPPALYCAWSQKTMQTKIYSLPVPTSPFLYTPISGLGMAGRRWKITSDTLTLSQRTAQTGNRTQVASVRGQNVTTRPPRLILVCTRKWYLKCYKNENSFEICHWTWSSKLSCKILRRYDQPFLRKVAIFGNFPDIPELKLSLLL